MGLIDLLRRLAELAGDLVAMLRTRRQAEMIKAEIAAAQLKDLIDAMDKTRLARLRSGERDRDAGGLRDDDGHRRD
jgi:hypothetical protein